MSRADKKILIIFPGGERKELTGENTENFFKKFEQCLKRDLFKCHALLGKRKEEIILISLEPCKFRECLPL